MWDLVKFVMCNLVSRAHFTYYILRKGYTVPGNQGTNDKLNQIRILYGMADILSKGKTIL